MSGSTYGVLFKISTWGESHGAALGVTIDGCPAGLDLSEADVQTFLNRRKPGQGKFSTQRKEGDVVEILSGVFENKTTGTPISMIVRNMDQKSRDYGNIADIYRPGHADYTFQEKYGIRDYRGGGRSSGRETISRVAAGAVASKILNQLGISICAYTKSIGTISIPESKYNLDCISDNLLYMPNQDYAAQAASYIEECMNAQDSVGGIIECVIENMPTGIGDTVFEKLDANLAKGLMSIGSVKGVEIGAGFSAAQMNGSINNDAFSIQDEAVTKKTNHAGGILGGMSDGSSIITRVAIKPTPSISQTQQTISRQGEAVDINIHGRHDPIIVPRAVVVVESMVAITLLDALFVNMSSKLNQVVDFYNTKETKEKG